MATGLAIATLTPALARPKAVKYTVETLAGNWQRIQRGGMPMKAFWSFQPDGAIACKGRDYSRASRTPKAYTVKRKKIATAFDHGTMNGDCKVSDGFVLMGGGADDGGFTFQR